MKIFQKARILYLLFKIFLKVFKAYQWSVIQNLRIYNYFFPKTEAERFEINQAIQALHLYDISNPIYNLNAKQFVNLMNEAYPPPHNRILVNEELVKENTIYSQIVNDSLEFMLNKYDMIPKKNDLFEFHLKKIN